MPIFCLGPKGSGKTHLLRRLETSDSVDNTTYSVPTVGTNIYSIQIPNKDTNASKRNAVKIVQILEIGGTMAPLWRQYFTDVNKIIYVVDTSNLCQISAAGVLLYSILVEPRLQRTKFLLVLTKMDLAYRQMRNEALLMLQIAKLQKEIKQHFTVIEASVISGMGIDKILDWLSLP
ncbi:unnamed protein product [Hermetia illucens]|uniref:ADP-ribosylation factor-like protein 16 n=1 Tax=Hermetia illucens TaxID=343691 RepID=A0A7R8Z1R9_HERIL|nr:ADP-ribosylation factor-like protein 16 [Hermetia illucens]CAD7092841.1 unnamed protein product [Hermetia illucens]